MKESDAKFEQLGKEAEALGEKAKKLEAENKDVIKKS